MHTALLHKRLALRYPTSPTFCSSATPRSAIPCALHVGSTRAAASKSVPTKIGAEKNLSGSRKRPALFAAVVNSGFAPTCSLQRVARAPRKPVAKPEILAPAGDWPQLRAAVNAGADAVYFGLNALNARARAPNFDVAELPAVMNFLHEHDIRGFVTMNVLVYDEELSQAESIIRAVAAARVDAVIVQDIGLVSLVRRVAPNLSIHGSTQMSVTSPEGAEFARELGCSRVVVGRELSTRDISTFYEATDVEIEVFVHGALCVSYSGQCFSSEAWGGRSANRGQCAQACRLPYGLVVNGHIKDMGDVKYLLSPQDLMAVEMVPELINAGVACFKIEGRLKGPEYVALTTSMYRRATDEAWEARGGDNRVGPWPHKSKWVLSDADRIDLAQVFARGQDADHDGLTPGFLEGPMHQRLVRGRAPKHRGVLIGKVIGCNTRCGVRVTVRLRGSAEVKRGIGVVFDRGAPNEPEAGGYVYEVIDPSTGQSVARTAADAVCEGIYELTFSDNVSSSWGKAAARDRNPVMPAPGDLVWRSSDPELETRLRKMATESLPQQKREPVTVRLSSGGVGYPLSIAIIDGEGREGVASTTALLQPADNAPLSFASIAKMIGHLGGTPFDVGQLDVSGLTGLDAGVFMSAREVKRARREAVEVLLVLRRASSTSPAIVLADDAALTTMLEEVTWWGDAISKVEAAPENWATHELACNQTNGPFLSLLCRTKEQAVSALNVPWLKEIVLDFLEVHGLQDMVRSVQASGRTAVVATPRVLKPNEEKLWQFYIKIKPDALLVRSSGLMRTLTHLRGLESGALKIPPLRGDFSLNAANALGASTLLRRGMLQRLTPTHDLNAKQLVALSNALGPAGASKLEVVIHQHLPIFHTEHCVFCRFLSTGNSYKDCGHPCETNVVHLRDGEGADHLVLADMGCRNTVFNASVQSGAEFAVAFLRAGVRHFRVELVDEPSDVVVDILEAYRRVLLGERKGTDVVEWVGMLPDANGNSHGSGRGSLEIKKEIDRNTMKQTATAARDVQESRT